MSTGQPSRRVQRARSEFSHRRTSMDSMKTEFRNRFLSKLRATRSRSVDRFRRIVENYENDMEYRSLKELRQALLAEREAGDLLNSGEMDDVLREVEEEMRQVSLQYEGELYEHEKEKETEETITRLMGHCQVCSALSVDNICSNCNAQLNLEFAEQ